MITTPDESEFYEQGSRVARKARAELTQDEKSSYYTAQGVAAAMFFMHRQTLGQVLNKLEAIKEFEEDAERYEETVGSQAIEDAIHQIRSLRFQGTNGRQKDA